MYSSTLLYSKMSWTPVKQTQTYTHIHIGKGHQGQTLGRRKRSTQWQIHFSRVRVEGRTKDSLPPRTRERSAERSERQDMELNWSKVCMKHIFLPVTEHGRHLPSRQTERERERESSGREREREMIHTADKAIKFSVSETQLLPLVSSFFAVFFFVISNVDWLLHLLSAWLRLLSFLWNIELSTCVFVSLPVVTLQMLRGVRYETLQECKSRRERIVE